MIIETEYKEPTNSNGGRVLARMRTSKSARAVVPWNPKLSIASNHDAALIALLSKIQSRERYWVRHPISGGGYLYLRGPARTQAKLRRALRRGETAILGARSEWYGVHSSGKKRKLGIREE